MSVTGLVAAQQDLVRDADAVALGGDDFFRVIGDRADAAFALDPLARRFAAEQFFRRT
jgi:hypothetical protein